MRLVLVHYHLQRGGVTRVMENALRSLSDTEVEPLVVTSAPPEEDFPFPVRVVRELAYRSEGNPADAQALGREILVTATQYFGTAPDLWHVHNPGLGKNVLLPDALHFLLREGARLLIQVHDFAEEGRPANFRRQLDFYRGDASAYAGRVWPISPQIAYAVLNSRDQEILRSAGVPPSQLHLLPNPVLLPDEPSPPDELSPRREESPLLLYPTRGIRRKNLGEILLLARLFPRYQFATTLAPRNPQWAAVHDGWRSLAREMQLPVEFAVGESGSRSFSQWVRQASFLLTTSVGEGFGMAFLEPFLFGREIRGRDLPGITADFRRSGLHLPGLYAEWPIATAAFDLDGLRKRFIKELGRLLQAYGQRVSPEMLGQHFDELAAPGWIDFGRLDEDAQKQALRQPLSSLFPGMDNPQPFSLQPMDPHRFTGNLQILKSRYGLAAYQQQLQNLYADLLNASFSEPRPLQADAILKAFLSPDRFRFLLS